MIFLTYSNTCFDTGKVNNTISREIIANKLKELGAYKGSVACEAHASGKWHFHALACWPEKLTTKNVRLFDIPCADCKDHHPNVQTRSAKTPRQWEQAKLEYVMKEDTNVFVFGNMVPAYMKNSKGFTKADQDFKNWQRAREKMHTKAITEFKMPYNPKQKFNLYEMPDKTVRRRLLIIHGEPGCGKTKWVQEQFGGKKAYMRENTSYPYEKLSDENVIIFDDIPLDTKNIIEEIIHVMNVWDVVQHVWGNSRYSPNYYIKGSVRVIIWIMNTDRKDREWAAVLADPRIKSRTYCVYECHKEPELEDIRDMSDSEDGVIEC